MKRKILIVDDEKPTRDVLARALGRTYACLTAPDAATALGLVRDTPDLDLILTDYKMEPGDNGVVLVEKAKKINPRLGCILVTAFGEVELAVAAMKRGANDFIPKPITDLDALEDKIAAALPATAAETAAPARANEPSFASFTGASAAMREVYRLIRKVAPARANVLVEGPSGTGKELVARALHDLSPRAKGSFVAVECSALSKDLLESELFGYAPGSFTGGLKDGKAGCFEAADGGTLFLDEIGEIDAATQVKLLRTLETRTVTRIGSTKPVAVDFRLVAATNRDLARLVAAGTFREDLYYRLNVIGIRMPALKDRPGDVALLVRRFLDEFGTSGGTRVTAIAPDALAALERYDWPGNVRQLRNAIERMVVLASGPTLTVRDLPPEVAEPSDAARQEGRVHETDAPSHPSAGTLEDAEKRQILAALAAANNNKSKAAEALGISRRTLHRKIKEWNL